MKNNLETLKSLAAAATPGPWEFLPSEHVEDIGSNMKFCGAGNDDLMIAMCGDNYCQQSIADSKFIAAANPAVVLELIAEREDFIADMRAILLAEKHNIPIIGMLESAIKKAEQK